MPENIENVLVLLTNIPGSGKSTIGKAIRTVGEEHGLTTHIIDEFKIFGDWIGANKHDAELMQLVHAEDDNENGHYELTDIGYELVFNHIATEIINEFNTAKSTSQIIISEAARNIGGVTYLPLFSELVKAIGENARLVNLNVIVSDSEDLMQRVKDRYEANPFTASPAVLRLYLDALINAEIDEYPSSVDTAENFTESFLYNADLYNDGPPDEVVETVRGIFAQLVPSYWLEEPA